jgi:hypothetical protein
VIMTKAAMNAVTTLYESVFINHISIDIRLRKVKA